MTVFLQQQLAALRCRGRVCAQNLRNPPVPLFTLCRTWRALLCFAALLSGCDSHSPPAPPTPASPAPPGQPAPRPQIGASGGNQPVFEDAPVSTIRGVATWYEVPKGSLPERRAPGEYTAAFDSLPLGTYVRVTNDRTGEAVTVCITDRGVGKRRTIDLCKEAAEQISLVGRGKAKVLIEELRARKP